MTDRSCFDTKRGGGSGTGRVVGQSRQAQSLHREVASNRKAIDGLAMQKSGRPVPRRGLREDMVGLVSSRCADEGFNLAACGKALPKAPSSDRFARAAGSALQSGQLPVAGPRPFSQPTASPTA